MCQTGRMINTEVDWQAVRHIYQWFWTKQLMRQNGRINDGSESWGEIIDHVCIQGNLKIALHVCEEQLELCCVLMASR